ncbi:archaeosortase/exosortase family protein [Paenibacillus chartarius]|uniref:Archaeosortase/exosortase family protein n=1 Tax=Paenibacillus chartarius TaxID=747481 RepID=A0ABV6DRB0_9BACL
MAKRLSLASGSSTTRWVWQWILCSTIPFIPYLLPLLQNTLGDTPLAYLTWIPVMAFFWAGWNMLRIPIVQRGEPVDGWIGLALLAATGVIIVTFSNRDLALFLWPVWSAFMALAMFGRSAVPLVRMPMIYLLLVCPPIYLKIVETVSPPLERFTMGVLEAYRHSVDWLQLGVTADNGIGVRHGAGWVLVRMTTACSGADSILAIIILLPVMLVVFQSSLTRKAVIVVAGSVLAVLANTARIVVILTALHYFGIPFAMHVLHPILGAVLFFTTIALLLFYSSRRFMINRPSANIALQGPAGWKWLVTVAAAAAFGVMNAMIFLR